jgi:glucan biosynthesis protein C
MNQTLPESLGNRILFLDNIRYLMVVFVVLLHAAMSYGTFGRHWVVGDAVANIKLFDMTLLIIDVFAMPVLFFIAGYFALPNIQKKGPCVFLKDKFMRLGIPWLISIIFIVPIITYIYQYNHLGGKPLLSYGQFWINWMKIVSDFPTGFWSPMYPNIFNFNQTAYWFISLLLFFFIIFTIIYILKKRICPSSSIQEKTHAGKKMLLIMLSVWLLNVIMSVFVNMIPAPFPDPFVIIAGVLQFQIWRLATYIIYFTLGVYAFSRNWFVKDNHFPGHPLLWIAICIILCFGLGLIVILSNLLSNIQSIQTDSGLIITLMLLRSLLRETFLIVFASIAFRYWNRPHKINETFAANSYNIYLVHLPLVVVLQLLLVNLVGISSLVKFGIVSFLSLLMSYAISRYAIKPHPHLSVAAVLMIFFLMVIFV